MFKPLMLAFDRDSESAYAVHSGAEPPPVNTLEHEEIEPASEPSSSAPLSCQNITVMVGTKTLVDNVSLDVGPGEVVALVGPNGAGKSTLLKAICGETRPATGNIAINGVALHQWPTRELAKTRAVMPQDSRLAFAFSVREVVELGRFPHCNGATTPHDRQVARDAMAAVGVLDLAFRDCTTLSGGERARVNCARALAQIWPDAKSTATPRLLLLDEPTAALDLKHQGTVMSLVRQFAKAQNVAVLAVLHDINLAAEYADRIAWMKGGKLVTLGTPVATLTPETLKLVYDVESCVVTHPTRGIPVALIERDDDYSAIALS